MATSDRAKPAGPPPPPGRRAPKVRERFPEVSNALLERLDRPAPRYTSYPTAPTWRPEFGANEFAEALADAGCAEDEPLSLYVHIPFCREMCTYCGCHVVVSKDPTRADRYLDVVIGELALLAKHLGARRRLARVHLGGGTPTFLDEAQLLRLWRGVRANFQIDEGAEIAVEIDPVATRAEQMALLGDLGFNRASFGVQDFDPAVQRAVKRIQTVEETAAMVEEARRRGFRSINFDLIYGLPLQRPAGWAQTLEQVIALEPDRLAVYSFAYVPAQRPNQRKLPVLGIPLGRAKLGLLEQAWTAFTGSGYEAIGIDHFAKHEDELAIAHREGSLWRDFQGYTVRRALDTVAVGASGISTLQGAIAQTDKSLVAHAEAVAAGRLPTERGRKLTDDDRRRRDVITELMCNDVVDLGADAAKEWARELEALEPLAADGLCEVVSGRMVRLSPVGRIFARNVAAVFDAYLGDGAPAFSRTV